MYIEAKVNNHINIAAAATHFFFLNLCGRRELVFTLL